MMHAQEGAAQSKTPPTPVKAVLDNWNDVGKRLITMAEDWPEDKYSYKLTPQVRSVFSRSFCISRERTGLTWSTA